MYEGRGQGLGPVSVLVTNAIRKYDIRELVVLGIEWIWLGLESSDTGYAKLKGTDTLTLVRELQAHGICVHGRRSSASSTTRRRTSAPTSIVPSPTRRSFISSCSTC